MLQGWDTTVETWSAAQMNKYMDWSSSVVPPTTSQYSNMTDYAGAPSTTTVEMTTFSPGQNTVLTTNDPSGLNVLESPERGGLIKDEPKWRVTTGDDAGYADMFAELDALGVTVPGSGVEMQELGTSVPQVLEPHTIGEIRPFNVADQWEMPRTSFSGNIVADLDEHAAIPEVDMSTLQKLVPPSELESVFKTALMDVDAFGVGNYNLEALMGGLGGAVFNVAVMNPLLKHMKENWGTFGEITSDTIQFVGAAGMLWGADILGIGATALITIAQLYGQQMARINTNDYASDVADTRLMMVLDNGKYYPAVIKDRVEGEGLLDTSNTINVAYGRPEDLRFVYENGKYRAHFAHQKNKQFRMDDTEWSGEKSTLAYNETRDFMKPFYFLSQEEALNVLDSYGTKDFNWTVVDQDRSSFTPFMKDYSELQAALDLMQSREQKTSDASTFLESDSKGIRHHLSQRFMAGERAFETDSYQMSRALPKAGETYGMNSMWDSYTAPGKPGLPSMHELNSEVITRKMKILSSTRKLAAESSGVDYRVYNDFVKDLPVASSYSALKDQFTAISNYNDRNDLQKQYLQEKAGVRYLMGVSNHFGYAADLHDVLFETAGPVTLFDQERLVRKAAVLGGTRTYITNKDILPDSYYSTESGAKVSALTETPAWVNKGETPLGWMDLAGWQKTSEQEFIQADSRFRQSVIEEVGYDPEELIKHNGMQIKEINVAHELERSKQYTHVEEEASRAADRATEEAMVLANTTGRKLNVRKGEKKMETRRQEERIQYERVKGYKQDWAARQEQLKRDWTELERDSSSEKGKHWDPMTGNHKLSRRFVDTNKKITYSSFLHRIKDPAFDPHTVGVSTVSDLLMGLLHQTSDWVPPNLKFNKHNLPAEFIQGQEENFIPLLEQIDDMPGIKQNAARLHELVYAPKTEQYMQRFHHTSDMSNEQIAKDYSGVELFDDWSLPFIHRQNSVMVNHQIQSRMDFGFEEI